jgi:hypothetical protein
MKPKTCKFLCLEWFEQYGEEALEDLKRQGIKATNDRLADYATKQCPETFAMYSWESVKKWLTKVRAGEARRDNTIAPRAEMIMPTPIALKVEVTEEELEKQLEDKVTYDRQFSREKAKQKEFESKYNYVLRQLEESEARFDALIQIKEDVSIKHIEPTLSSTKHEAVPMILLSDWHFEERVDDFTINGLNHYNLEIAGERWVNCIQRSQKLVHIERQSSDIGQLVLWLGGDFITGYIHEELEESNYLSPVQAIRFAKEKIITAIKFYLQHGNYKKITVVCNYGNHGRTNKKPRIGTSYKNSYEWMMYKDIQDYFADNKTLDFVVPDGLFAYVNILNHMIRFWHGDTIKFGGGIGGLTVPLIKAIHRYDGQIHADYNIMGHYHQYWEATKNCTVNGSGIGFNPYAQSIGASPERPTQGFRVVDSKWGMTTKRPVFCD